MRLGIIALTTALALAASPALAKPGGHGGSPAPGHCGDNGQGHGKQGTPNPGGVGGPPGHHGPDGGHPSNR